MDVLHLVVYCQTSCVWHTLEKVLTSPLNYGIMQVRGSFQDLRQADASVTTCMQHAKSLFDELAAASQPFSLEDFNLYIFYGLSGGFKDLITSLVTKAESLSYADLHNYLLTHEFLHKTSLPSMTTNPPLLPTQSMLPFTHLAQHQHRSILTVTEVVHTATGALIAVGITASIGLIFMGFHSSTPTD
jgi:hypothetical protein